MNQSDAPVGQPLRGWMRIAFWLAPSVLFVALYWPALQTGFLYDDFAWLQLHRNRSLGVSVWQLLFDPTLHGTWRPISERAFFLVLGSLSPTSALPFRLVVFATQLGAMALLSSILLRLTRSRLAALLAPILWILNSNITGVVSWASAYMQVLCGFCLLLAFHLLLRFVETGRWRYYWLQVLVFLAGFGVMETNLVYPALAGVYVLFFARKHLRHVLPLFGVSAVFVALHMALAPKASGGAYAQHFDFSMLRTLLSYWRLALKPLNLDTFAHTPRILTYAWALAVSVAMVGFVAWSSWRRKFLPLVFLSWFGFLLAPVLPLRDHISPYYLTLPLLALGTLGAWAAASAWCSKSCPRTAGVVLVAVYAAVAIPSCIGQAQWWRDRGGAVANAIEEVRKIRLIEPKKIIVLSEVPQDVFSDAIIDGCFEAMNLSPVKLLPELETRLARVEDRARSGSLFITAEELKAGLRGGEVVVYSLGDADSRAQTAEYTAKLVIEAAEAPPAELDLGATFRDELLAGDWYKRDEGHRWMGKKASIRLRGPSRPGQKLYLDLICPETGWPPAPQRIRVSAGKMQLGEPTLETCPSAAHFEFDAPAAIVGKADVLIDLEVDRTFAVPGDNRQFGLALGVVAFR